MRVKLAVKCKYDDRKHTEEKMERLIWKERKQNGLLRRFIEEEDAVGVVEIILILVEN